MELWINKTKRLLVPNRPREGWKQIAGRSHTDSPTDSPMVLPTDLLSDTPQRLPTDSPLDSIVKNDEMYYKTTQQQQTPSLEATSKR